MFTEKYLKTLEDTIEWLRSNGSIDGVTLSVAEIEERLLNDTVLMDAELVTKEQIAKIRAIKRSATDEEARTMDPDGHIDADTVYLSDKPLPNLSGEYCYTKLEVYWYGGYTAVIGYLTPDEEYATNDDIWVFGDHVKLEDVVAEYLELIGLRNG